MAIGLYAAANGISRSDILEIQNLIASSSHYEHDREMDGKYTNLPRRNIENTDRGYHLYQSGRIAAAPLKQ